MEMTLEYSDLDSVFKSVKPGNRMTNLARGYYGQEVPVIQNMLAGSQRTLSLGSGFRFQDAADSCIRKEAALEAGLRPDDRGPGERSAKAS
jgi:hypothetical protein